MKTDYQKYVIHKIRELRMARNLSQKDLASLIGVSNGQIGNIESFRSSHKYTLCQVFRICVEFGVHVQDIFMDPTQRESITDPVSYIIECIIKYEECPKKA